MRKSIRSRINEFFPEEAIDELIKISRNRRIRDNNQKVLLIQEVLEKYNIENVLLGPGTNRVAFLIDNYVFKVAMDDWGVRDNNNEMAMSYELQPFVIKVYECNGILAVSEYVTLITEEEFYDSREMILNILEDLSESYLLGDVGYTAKNFTNWGYRDNGDLVILDFAYIYQITTDILRCSDDGRMLAYNDNFTRLRCPHCTRIYEFMEIRKRIPREFELERNKSDLDYCYKVGNKKLIMVEDEEGSESEHNVKRGDILSPDTKQNSNTKQEESNMSNEIVETHEDAFERIQRRLMEAKAKKNPCSFEGDPHDDSFKESVVETTNHVVENSVEDKTTEELADEIDSMIEEQPPEVSESVELVETVTEKVDVPETTKFESGVIVEKEITNKEDLDLFTELEQKEMARVEKKEKEEKEKELAAQKKEEASTFEKHLLSIAEAEEFTGNEFDEDDEDEDEDELYTVRRK